jgi:Protein of unknown function (DUF2934)
MTAPKARRTRPTKSARGSAPPGARREIERVASAPPEGADPAVERGEARLDAAERERLIRTAAYLRAEYRGFQPGHELEDWLAAERDIDHWITSRAAPRRYSC